MRFKQGCKMWWLALLAVVLDRLTKLWSLRLTDSVEFIPGVLNSNSVRNFGAAFGAFSGRIAFISIVTLVLLAGIVFLLFRYPDIAKFGRAGLWLILAGGFSNLFDRLYYGYVIDFLEFGFIQFPVFNIADVCIVLGCILCFIAVFFMDRKKAQHG